MKKKFAINERPSCLGPSPAAGEPRSLIRAVCLDWSGTTVDFGCHGPVEVMAETFEQEGVHVSHSEVREPMGAARRDHIRLILGLKLVSSRWQEVHGRPATEEDVERLYARFLPLQVRRVRNHSEPIPGVPELMAELESRGIRVAATTGYGRDVMNELQPLAAEAGFSPAVTITADDVDRGRPAPDQLLLALRSMGGVLPEHAIAVDDTATGIRAGRLAGMWTVGVASSGNYVGLDRQELDALRPAERRRVLARARQRLYGAGAHAVVDLVTDLLPVTELFDRLLSAGCLPSTVLDVSDDVESLASGFRKVAKGRP